MGRADDAGFRIGKQHRAAIGGRDAERESRPVGHHRIRLRARRGKGSRTTITSGEWIW